MSVVSASYLGIFIVLLSNVTVNNGSLVHVFCQYPNSELCVTLFHRLNDLNRYNAELSQLNSWHSTVDDEPFLDEEAQLLANQLQAFRNTLLPPEENLLRCINLGDDSCNNGALPGSGKDNDYLNGNGNPGKRTQSIAFKIR